MQVRKTWGRGGCRLTLSKSGLSESAGGRWWPVTGGTSASFLDKLIMN
jgi:hypothetical protein